MINNQFRQGDILLDRVEGLPADAVEVKVSRNIVLARGASGSTHAVPAKDAKYYEAKSQIPTAAAAERLRNRDSHLGLAVAFLVVNKDTKLVHSASDTAHAAIPVPTGTYMVIRAREADVTGERLVQD